MSEPAFPTARFISEWGGIMPWTRSHRWIAFLLLVSVLAVGIGLGAIASRNRVGGDLSPTEERLIAACLTIAFVGVSYARMEHVQRKGQNVIGRKAEEAASAAGRAVEEAQKANQTLPDRVMEKLEASPMPTSHNELVTLIREVKGADCEQLLERAYPRMLKAAREAGWQPPQQNK